MKLPPRTYMHLTLHVDGGDNLHLIAPTYWDDTKKTWAGFVKTPKFKKLIYGEGKTSFDLENSFNKAMSEILQKGDELSEDAFSLFKDLTEEELNGYTN